MIRFSVVVFFVLAVSSSVALAGTGPGPAPEGGALGQYDPATGQIVVSVNNILAWVVEYHGADAMTGDEPMNLPGAGGIIGNSDTRISEHNVAKFSYTNLDLGNVAQPGLPDDGNLIISWAPDFGTPTQHAPLVFGSGLSNASPLADLDGPHIVDLLNDPLNITLDASGSTDDGIVSPLTYQWDLNNDGIFEVDTGTIPTLDIADVSSTFGGHGFYQVAVEVSDSELTNVAYNSVQLFSEPIVPAEAQYDPATGQIVVSIYGVGYWEIHSISHALNGDEPVNLPAGGGDDINTDWRIGESMPRPAGYTIDLGNVAQKGLPEGELVLSWRGEVGEPLQSKLVTIVPEPTGLVLAIVGVIALGGWRRNV